MFDKIKFVETQLDSSSVNRILTERCVKQETDHFFFSEMFISTFPVEPTQLAEFLELQSFLSTSQKAVQYSILNNKTQINLFIKYSSLFS